jgi:dTDP-4-dehydrorhamnose reductase
MQKILITGCNGFLGQHLTQYFAAKKLNVIAVGRGACRIENKNGFIYESIDLTDTYYVNKCLQTYKPDIVIHAAAMSKPDECDANKKECLLQNVDVTDSLIQAAANFFPHFIYISTDFIFGENGPHSEDEIALPLNFYGETKLKAERIVRKSGLLCSIVRPVFIYGKLYAGMRPSFLHWVKNNLEQNKPIKVVSDQQRTPTYAIDICKGIESIICKRVPGDFNLAGKDIISPYQMAITVARVLHLNELLIENVTSATFPEVVVRAKQSGLKIDKAVKELNYHPVSFEEGVMLSFT